ncbi:MAG: cyclase [Gemmatimonadetes bacterium]|nr:cyclase [Gemmatimonadota bacterium]
MIRMFVRHPVTDFATWKQAYDDFGDERRGMGVVGDAVFQSATDPNDITAWHDFADLDAARSFAESDRLREVMESAGVAGEPQIWFTAQA